MARELPSIDLLAAWRPLFPVEAQRRGETLARSGGVRILRHDGERASARVSGPDGACEVELDLENQSWKHTSCSCPAFDERGPCQHMWAVLQVVVAGLATRADAAPEGAPGMHLRNWLGALRRIEREVRPERGAAGAEKPAHRVDYVLALDHPGAAGFTVLETRCARPLARGGFGKCSPFALFSPRSGIVLGAQDRRLAALLRGASPLLPESLQRGRNLGHCFLDDEQTLALLPELCATGRLFWSRAGETSTRPLTLDEGEPWKPCALLVRDAERDRLRLVLRLERGGERVEGGEIRGVLADDRVVLDERIVRARLGRGRVWFMAMVQAPPPSFTTEEAPELLLELARREIDAEPSVGLEGLIAARRPTPVLTLAAPRLENGRWSAVEGAVEFDYGVARVAATDRRPLLPTGRGVLRRYFEIEDALLGRALGAGARSPARGTFVLSPAEVPGAVRELTADGWIVQGEGARWRTLSAPRISVESGVDWFELEGRIEGVAGDGLPRLLAALRRGESSVRLDDGSTGILPAAWIARWRTAVRLGEEHAGKLRFRSNQALIVDLLLSEFVERESRRLWEEQRARLAEFRSPAPVREPPGFRGELRPYQREGLGWLEFLERQRFGGCLADDMGLGKTVQVLAWLQARRERERRTAPTLIVTPKSLTHNWLEEARRFTPGLRVLEYVGAGRKPLLEAFARHDLVLTTYGTVRMDVEALSRIEFGAVILDEAQAIKNEGSRTARSVRVLRAAQRLALSGTPIENHLGELWSLFEFLNPGMLGRSSAFHALIGAPGDAGVDSEARALITAAVRPFLLRRTKEGVLRDLPERSEQTVLCDMEAAQRREYVELREHFRSTLLSAKSDAELRRDTLGVLEMLLRLRQAACHPALIDPTRAEEGCAKFDALFAMLEDVIESGHKALVFSQFTSLLALVRRRLDAVPWTYGYLDGQTPAARRAQEVARFQQDPERKLFLLSLKAGGTGLNLTAADYVILLDPWWNPAVESQAIGRSHRIGQERKVFAYRLVCRDTIEERVLELQARKRDLAASILEGDGSLLRELTREDLEHLLG